MTLENQRTRWSIVVGSLLVLGGIVLMLVTFGVLQVGAVFWVGAFDIVGGIFLAVFLQNRKQWWALIPGMALLGVGTTIAGNEFFPPSSLIHQMAGAFVLLFIGLAFTFIYLRDTQQWWPLIPMGALFSVAAITVLATTTNLAGEVLGSLLFFGMALTFSMVALRPTEQGQTRWALIPAAILALLGVLTAGMFTQALTFMWPAMLIITGFAILILNLWRQRHSH